MTAHELLARISDDRRQSLNSVTRCSDWLLEGIGLWQALRRRCGRALKDKA